MTLTKNHCSRIPGAIAATLLALVAAQPAAAAVPGITGTTFNLVAGPGYGTQPDGASIYSWGYGCDTGTPAYAPAAFSKISNCPAMQLPGPTLIVTEGDFVTVNLANKLPPAAGSTSILFPGMVVTSSGGAGGLLAQEAPSGGTVQYTFTAVNPGTHSYYSGTQPDLQVEMGLYGALIVLPKTPAAGCTKGEFALSSSAYSNANTCYDREYLFQLGEINSRIHDAALAQVKACPTGPCPAIVAVMEPYHPNYFVINGRSMPDNMDVSFTSAYPNQPYNANPHMHPGELVLMRIIGQGRTQHPFHFHGNHARVLGRDGNLMVSATNGTDLAGPLLFTTPSVPGQSQDQIFTWTGKGLNWDVYNHGWAGDTSTCTPDKNGYHSVVGSPNYGEWCADHGKPIPVTPPDPTIVQIGQWYGGTPYLGIQRQAQGFSTSNEPPGTLNQNPQAGYAYMWHSHNEREITTNNVFPGGMMSMLLIDPPYVAATSSTPSIGWHIDETQ